MQNPKVLESLLLAFWREYGRQANKPHLAVADCHDMNNDIDIEHKMVATLLRRLWDTISPGDIDAARICGTNQVSDPLMVIPDAEWEAIGDQAIKRGASGMPDSLLAAAIQINGTRMHLQAFEVQDDQDRGQIIVNPALDGYLDNLRSFADAGDFRTTTMRGRHYVVVATPQER